MSGLLSVGKLLESLGNDAQTLAELSLSDDQRRSETDNVTVGGLGQETLALEQKGQVPGSAAVGSSLVNDAGVQQTLTTDKLDDGRVDLLDALTEDLAEFLSVLNHLLLLNQLEGTDRDGTAEWVTTVGRTVGSGLDNAKDVLVGENGRDGVHTTGDGLSEGDHVGLDASPVRGKHLTSSADTGLDLISNEENVVLLAKSVGLGEVVLIGDNDTSLTLDGLDEESSGLLAVGLEDLLKVSNVVVSDGLAGGGRSGANVGDVRSVVVARLGVGGESDGSHLFIQPLVWFRYK